MRSLLMAAAMLLLACGRPLSTTSTDLLAPADLSSAADLVSIVADLAACGDGCASADFVVRNVTLGCPFPVLGGVVCNQGSVAAATVAAFYYSHEADGLPLPSFDPSRSTLLCTAQIGTLAPGVCVSASCAPGLPMSNSPTGDYWLRVNDNGQSFPLAAECCADDDVGGTWIDCTLP